MSEVRLNIDAQHLIEMFDKGTKEKKFLILIDNEWREINQDEYNTIIRGNKNE